MPDATFQQSDSQQIALAQAALADEIRAVGCKRSQALQLVGQDPVKGARAVAKIDAELEALKNTATVLDDAAQAAQQNAQRAARQAAVTRAAFELKQAIALPRQRVQTAAEFDAAIAQVLEIAKRWREQGRGADAYVCQALGTIHGTTGFALNDALVQLRPRATGASPDTVIEVARYVRQLIDAMGLADAIHPVVVIDRFSPARGGSGCLELAALADADYVATRLDRYQEE